MNAEEKTRALELLRMMSAKGFPPYLTSPHLAIPDWVSDNMKKLDSLEFPYVVCVASPNAFHVDIMSTLLVTRRHLKDKASTVFYLHAPEIVDRGPDVGYGTYNYISHADEMISPTIRQRLMTYIRWLSKMKVGILLGCVAYEKLALAFGPDYMQSFGATLKILELPKEEILPVYL